jgi:hypothetical protein
VRSCWSRCACRFRAGESVRPERVRASLSGCRLRADASAASALFRGEHSVRLEESHRPGPQASLRPRGWPRTAAPACFALRARRCRGLRYDVPFRASSEKVSDQLHIPFPTPGIGGCARLTAARRSCDSCYRVIDTTRVTRDTKGDRRIQSGAAGRTGTGGGGPRPVEARGPATPVARKDPAPLGRPVVRRRRPACRAR